MLKEFREFIMRGNVLDLAIAVIMGAAFGAIVTSLVNDIIMPPVGKLAGSLNFSDLFVPLDGKTYANLTDAKKAGAPIIAYGQFINTVINFLIVAFCVFLIVKQVNRFKKPAAAPDAAPSTKECRYCASSIPSKAVRCPHCTSQLEGTLLA